MNKPENKIKKALELAGYGITILGAVSVAEIIPNWIIGGWNGSSIDFIYSGDDIGADHSFSRKENKILIIRRNQKK